MRRIFIDGPLSESMTVSGELVRHIGLSLRMAVGDMIGVAGTGGQCGRAEIVSISAATVQLKLIELTDSPEPAVAVWLAQSLPKGDKMDLIVQKAVELGVQGIFPLQTAHCIVRYEPAKQTEKLRRWQKISQEAAGQSGRGIVPVVGPFLTWQQLFERVTPQTQLLILYEAERNQGLRRILTQQPGKDWIVVIGPEGGLSEDEVRRAEACGALLAGLGPRVLRAETAGLAALSVIMYQYGDLGGS
jgi:16S rRNA (uracil1498-N3)-methyltransferase